MKGSWMTRSQAALKIAMLLCLALALPGLAYAHLGPPFPILVDQLIPGYSVTVLANPDVSQAVVIVVFEPVKSAPAGKVSGVDVWVQPLSGRLPKAVCKATQQTGRGPLRFLAAPDIDAAEMIKIGIDIDMADGAKYHFATQVKATPPGVGPWGLLLFSFPLLLFGALGTAVVIRRSRLKREELQSTCNTPGADRHTQTGECQ